MNSDAPDAPLGAASEGLRRSVLKNALSRAPFDGWTAKMLGEAVRAAGAGQSEAALLFPRGICDLLQFWSEELNAIMARRAAAPDFQELRIRDKVTVLVEARLCAMENDKEAARRAAATLALPHNAPVGAKLSWGVADAVWRALGDASTDFNYYSKRAILTGVWTSTFARWLADESEDGESTKAFLAARIENVMQIEKLKAKLRKTGIDPQAFVGSLAKARYPRHGD